ncbi:alpha/beta hydrolase [Streptomyces sp. NBC_00986]|uniref:alpha/beta hydrolase n=1 Tax=Streptomyces sp. NBC_00986 TaxID=2903702 RepID=UPI003863C976|nr:alpha/beta hydrolase family protein [Streptomyces sp. NBC_00986]
MDLATLKALESAEYAEAADGYRSTSDMASAVKDRIENQIAVAMRNSLKGEAATAAVKELTELGKNFHYIQVECGLLSTALEAFSYEVGAAKAKLDAALDGAAAVQLTVNSDGSVTYPPGGQKGADGKIPDGGTVSGLTDGTASAVGRQAANFDPNPHHRLAQDYADQIASALKEATEADEKWAPKLAALKADDDLTVSDKDWVDASSDTSGVREAGRKYLDSLPQRPKDGSPEDNAEWWKGLTAEERAAWLSVDPKAVGELNGLPSAVRDEANRVVFDETRARLRLELDSIPNPPADEWTWINSGPTPSKVHTDAWMDWYRQYGDRQEQLRQTLSGMGYIQDRFDRTGEGGLPEAYLLGFDPVGLGDGKVIIANGNPDLADHVAVYVPGTFAGLEKIGEGGSHGDLGRGETLWAESAKLAPGQNVSTITWLDYNAPDSIVPQATNAKYAEEGGPRLYDFLQGNWAAHEEASGNAAHTTVLGHSYGSTVVGVSAQSGKWSDSEAVDDYMFAGSPGVEADHAADLGIGADHVWAMGAPGNDEIVRQGGRLMGLGDELTIPTDDSFGGNVMKSDSADHGGFWDTDGQQASLSLENQARVITGRYGDVVLED